MDPRQLSPEQRLTLSLGDSDVTSDVVVLRRSEVGQGKGLLLSAVSFASLIAQGAVDVRPMEVPTAAAVGLELQEVPMHRGLIVASHAGERVEGRSLQGRATTSTTLQDGSLVILLEEDDVYVATTTSGTIAFGIDNGQLVVTGESLGVAPLAELAGDPAWVALATEDWLKETVDSHLARRTTWGNVSAAALLSRVSGISADPDVVDERVAQPRRWARSWSVEERRTVEDLAVARVDRLMAELDSLEEALHQGQLDHASVDRVEALCLERATLQGVATLLWEANGLGRLPDALAALDERGEEVAPLFPIIDEASDLLQAAAAMDHDAWWTQPLLGS
jgi:hypothetical protein